MLVASSFRMSAEARCLCLASSPCRDGSPVLRCSHLSTFGAGRTGVSLRVKHVCCGRENAGWGQIPNLLHLGILALLRQN
jgi:hypothetical protein